MTEAEEKGPARWQVTVDGLLLSGGSFLTAGCLHRGGEAGACGGCFARYELVLATMAGDWAKAPDIYEEMCAALRTEQDNRRAEVRGTHG